MAEHKYIHKNIRILLENGFTADELRQFCTDEPVFRPVSNRLAPNSGKYEIIEKILEHADLRLRFDALLTWAEENNPIRFNKHKPYWEEEDITISSKSSERGINQKSDKYESGKVSHDGQNISGEAKVGSEFAETKEPSPGKTGSTGDIQEQVYISPLLNWFKDNRHLTLVVSSVLLILIVASYFWSNDPPTEITPTQEVSDTNDNTSQPIDPTKKVPATEDITSQPINDPPPNITDEFGIPMVLRPTFRGFEQPEFTAYDLGFRCADSP